MEGKNYEVVVVAINDQGEGGPTWFSAVDAYDGSLDGQYQDYMKRSCFAVPTCEPKSVDCEEGEHFLIKT